jgi:hypothetical protein
VDLHGTGYRNFVLKKGNNLLFSGYIIFFLLQFNNFLNTLLMRHTSLAKGHAVW